MKNNNQSNNVIKWVVIVADFVLFNALFKAFTLWSTLLASFPDGKREVMWLVCNLALALAETRFYTVIHQRLVTLSEIVPRIIALTAVQALVAYIILKGMDFRFPVGWLLFKMGTAFFVVLLLARYAERLSVKAYRRYGRNTRHVVLVGNDPELVRLYEKLESEPALGYRFVGYYADEPAVQTAADGSTSSVMPEEVARLGSVQELINAMEHPKEDTKFGDEMYVCLSRRKREEVSKISMLCDHLMIRFFYVPVSVESLGINLKSELLDDMEIFTTYENPLLNPVNKFVKRLFDIVMSFFFLLGTSLLLPIIYIIVKIQSPGPLFFKQLRTGLDGKNFNCYKFRSMHVNNDADTKQATKDDPRKYPFGNFMRKANIDELPQFWNVLKGDMSLVGPRPHMLAHTEMYSKLIDKYMVRHFVKPGVTGWAQVTGFRGETKELWQMEGRVKRDIWYMEHWSFWLDLRIIWLTAKSIFVHDEHAY